MFFLFQYFVYSECRKVRSYQNHNKTKKQGPVSLASQNFSILLNVVVSTRLLFSILIFNNQAPRRKKALDQEIIIFERKGTTKINYQLFF
jgi:hypothetical protein